MEVCRLPGLRTTYRQPHFPKIRVCCSAKCLFLGNGLVRLRRQMRVEHFGEPIGEQVMELCPGLLQAISQRFVVVLLAFCE
ncbi:MAG: hypothetical protein KF705_00135 [Phycisphaeraceae bacterium]|nr:hypothetical protein [Phycisphaeraceae bacterium]